MKDEILKALTAFGLIEEMYFW